MGQVGVSSTAGQFSADAYLAVVGKRQGAVKGESQTPGHVDEITVLTWHWGVTSPTATGTNQATGRRVYEVLKIDKHIDASSTKLMNALSHNEEIKSATLSLRKAGTDEDFFIVVLKDARVVGCQIQYQAGGALHETVSIAYQSIDITYHPQQSSGLRGASSSFSDSFSTAD